MTPISYGIHHLVKSSSVYPENSCYDYNLDYYNKLESDLKHLKNQLYKTTKNEVNLSTQKLTNYFKKEIETISKKINLKNTPRYIIIMYSKEGNTNVAYDYTEQEYIKELYPSLIKYRKITCKKDLKNLTSQYNNKQ